MPFLAQSMQLSAKVLELAQQLASIPSPSGFESEKAKFVQRWLLDHGIQSDIDEVGNVVVTMKAEQSDKTQLYLAHIDTVFGGLEKIVVQINGNRICAPSIGDNSCNAAALMIALHAMVDSAKKPLYNRIIAFNVGEEGLGNLRGVRALMQRYTGQIGEVIAIDATSDAIVTTAVGSIRYRVEVKTCGGHSYSAFGNPSAIHYAAQIIDRIYDIQVPKHPKTTYNVGIIEGGTSVNTIAQSCSFLLDLRSEDAGCLKALETNVLDILDDERGEHALIELSLLGERPCGIDIADTQLVDRVNAIRAEVGLPVQSISGSTDCNIPLSLGIPSVCFGVYKGRGAHTMEEYIEADSIAKGLQQLLMVFFDENI